MKFCNISTDGAAGNYYLTIKINLIFGNFNHSFFKTFIAF